MSIESNLFKINKNIDKAQSKNKRKSEKVSLVAVSKNVDEENILQAYRLKLRDFAENRVQNGRGKISELPSEINWHFIGHLQTNKVKYVVGNYSLIHSLDRYRLACSLDKEGAKRGVKVGALVQVNIAKDENKNGIMVEELEDFLLECGEFNNITIKGLMTMLPYTDNLEETRPYFKEMYNRYKAINIPGIKMSILSMGMSSDYTVAIEEGANMIRIGRFLFNSE